MARDKDQELLSQILLGNRIAMKEFYDIYSGYLTTVCSRYIDDKDDVKDILQESFIKIFKSINQFEYKGVGSIRAWSTRIVINESLKFIKAIATKNIVNKPIWDLPDLPDEDPDFEEIPTYNILQMIRSLPIGYRTIFNLYIFEEKSHKEIASILNITESTSASQLHRAKKILAQQINIYKSNKELNYE